MLVGSVMGVSPTMSTVRVVVLLLVLPSLLVEVVVVVVCHLALSQAGATCEVIHILERMDVCPGLGTAELINSRRG